MSRNQVVEIGSLSLRPLPKELFESVLCTNCKKNAARWEFAEGASPAKTFACSLCFLYEVPQLKEQRKQVDHLISEVEQQMSHRFPRDEDLRLILPNDADRVAFGIIMARRFMQSRMLRGGGFS